MAYETKTGQALPPSLFDDKQLACGYIYELQDPEAR